MAREIVSGPGVPRSHLPFSPAVKAGGFVFVSGQASVDDTGKIVPGTFSEEFRRTWDNVRKILAGAEMTFDDVVRVTSYLARQELWDEYNQIYRELFSDPPPARTTLSNCLGDKPNILYEVDVIAYRAL